ncbi:TM2 domain-containing membrane protein YozV [Methanofollis sp. W23]|uniref:hypothetical protein n=1 Tax=Methanofollis sp. W23 TaxID=2817849 RepID=UPI001E063A73|nr:hypothetical protein [Methanofollis sp. W23]MBP2145102.1 TM2 domain-containing membrane protein YozV [Methanofollis sp. W23]
MPNYCPNCGTPIKERDGAVCPNCGAHFSPTKQKNLAIALICAISCPGLGQVYNGEIGKGVLVLLGTAVGTLLLIPGLIVYLYGIYDGYRTAEKMNAGEVPFRETNVLLMILFVGLLVLGLFVLVLLAVSAAFVYGMGAF